MKDFHGSVSQHPPLPGRGGAKLIMPFRPSLAAERVNHIGEAVAVVIGETLAAAQDGAEAVAVEYADARAGGRRRGGRRAGRAAGASRGAGQHRGRLGRASRPIPDANAKEVERVVRLGQARRARCRCVHSRLNVASMEPRGATASYDAATDLFNLRVCSQGARAMRDSMAGVLKIGNDKIRVTTEEVGGAFGLKTGPYPEYIAILVGGEEDRPPGVLDVRPLRSVPDRQPRPRRLQRRRAGARREGQVPGAAHPPHRQHGRLHRRGRRQHPDHQHDALPARHVRHQADRRADPLRVHQHRRHRALSRRRPAGGELLHRARGRRGGAHHRHRPGPAAQAQPDLAQGHAVQDRGRHHLRLRRLRRGDRPGPGARRLRRLQGAQEASPRSAACCAASASASCWSIPAARRSKA